MDQLTALRKKVEELRAEISEICALNQEFVRDRKHGATSDAQVQRQARLEDIQHQLTRLAGLSRKRLRLPRRDRPRLDRPFFVKKAS